MHISVYISKHCRHHYYSISVEERSIAISLSVREHIFGTAGPIFTIFVQTPCGRTSGFMDDVTFGHNGPYGET